MTDWKLPVLCNPFAYQIKMSSGEHAERRCRGELTCEGWECFDTLKNGTDYSLEEGLQMDGLV